MLCHFELEAEDCSKQKYHLVPVTSLNTGEYKKHGIWNLLTSFKQYRMFSCLICL